MADQQIERKLDPLASTRTGPRFFRRRTARGLLTVPRVLSVYTVLALAWYWPLVVHGSTQFWAGPGDGSAFVWSYWSIPRSIFSLKNPFVTKQMFFPVGAHTALNANVPFWSLLSWPIAEVLSLSWASVIIGLIAVIGSGVGAFLLARRLGCSPWSAFFAGIAFEFLPYRTNRLVAHLNFIHTELLVFGLVCLLDVYEKPGRRQVALLGLVSGLTVLTDFTNTLLLVLAFGVLILMRWRETLRRETVSALARAALIGLVISLPLLIPAVNDLRHGENEVGQGLGGANFYSADLLSWVVPYERQPLWGSEFQGINTRATDGERVEFTGFVVLGLAGIALFVVDRRKRDWIAVAVVFGVLSFGPWLHIDNHTGGFFTYEGYKFSVPLPYLALNHLPGFRGFRAPGRFGVVASLALIMLAALAADEIGRRWKRTAVWLPVLAAAITLIEFLPPGTYTTLPVHVSPIVAQMAKDPSPGAVLDIPLQFRTGFGGAGDGNPSDARFLYDATIHRRAMAGGSVSRLPDRRLAELEAIPVYRQLLSLQGDPVGGIKDPATFTAADLDSLGIRFVVAHSDAPMPQAVGYIESLHLPLFGRDGSLTVWKVPG